MLKLKIMQELFGYKILKSIILPYLLNNCNLRLCLFSSLQNCSITLSLRSDKTGDCHQFCHYLLCVRNMIRIFAFYFIIHVNTFASNFHNIDFIAFLSSNLMACIQLIPKIKPQRTQRNAEITEKRIDIFVLS
jgi:hypothetical protein